MTSPYRRDIDGLRGIAVLAVVLFHAGYSSFAGGYVGVDVFFVISGYLITSIILKEEHKNEFSIARFYERRIRRIFPALFVTIFLTLAAGAILFIPADFKSLGRSAAAVMLFISNVLFWKESGYFDTSAAYKPLLHTWSLAVEEQFYIVFPLLLVAFRRLFRARFGVCLSIVGAGSLALCVYSTYEHPGAAFFLAPARAWELLLGALIACDVFPRSSNLLSNVLATVGILLIGASVLLLDSQTQYPGINALLPTLGTALIIYAGLSGMTAVGRALSARPLVSLGLISYSMYLLHWPLLVFAGYFSIVPLTKLQTLGLLIATVVLSVVSWRFVEQPFRSMRALNRKQLFAMAGVAMMATVIVGLSIDAREGVPQRFDGTAFNDPLSDPAWLRWKHCDYRFPTGPQGGLCSLGNRKASPNFLLWGDSHAAMFATGLDQSASRQFASGYIATANACPPVFGISASEWDAACVVFNDTLFTYIHRHPELKTIIVAARWAKYWSGGQNDSGRPIAEPSNWQGAKAASSVNIELRLTQTVRKLLEMGRSVVLVEPVPEVGIAVAEAYGIASWSGRDLNKLIAPTRKDYNARNHAILTSLHSLARLTGVQTLNVSEEMCDALNCRVIESGRPLYVDNNHLSAYGSQALSPLFDRLLKGDNSRP